MPNGRLWPTFVIGCGRVATSSRSPAPAGAEPAPDAPPEPGLLADVVEALEAGRLPSEAAIEEVVFLLRGRGLVEGELLRREALRTVTEIRARYPLLSMVAVARMAAPRVGAPSESIRRWARNELGTRSPDSPSAECDGAGKGGR